MPLIWAAAAHSSSHTVLDWLSAVLEGSPHVLLQGTARTGWLALRQRMREWGIASGEDLAQWFESEGLGTFTVNQYVRREVHEYVINRAVSSDGGVAALEASYVAAVLRLSLQPGAVAEALANIDMRSVASRAVDGIDASEDGGHLGSDERVDPEEPVPSQRPGCAPAVGWVRIQGNRDLERCLRSAGWRQQTHIPRVAGAEMRAAGVGASEPADPLSPTSRELLGLPARRQGRRQGTTATAVAHSNRP